MTEEKKFEFGYPGATGARACIKQMVGDMNGKLGMTDIKLTETGVVASRDDAAMLESIIDSVAGQLDEFKNGIHEKLAVAIPSAPSMNEE